MAAYVIIPRKLLCFVLSGFNYGLHLLGSPRPVRPRPSPQPPALVPRSQDRARSRRANTPVSFSESFTLEPEYHEARPAIRARKGSPSDDDRFLSTKTTISLKTTSAAESGWTSSGLLTFSRVDADVSPLPRYMARHDRSIDVPLANTARKYPRVPLRLSAIGRHTRNVVSCVYLNSGEDLVGRSMASIGAIKLPA